MLLARSTSAVLVVVAYLTAGAPLAPAQTPDSTLVGDCAPATVEAFLDVNDVRAKILNNGGLFWNGGANVYEVPKESGLSSLFTASLWLGGKVDGEIRLAGTRYGPYEFWPGPIPDDGSNPKSCARFDRIHGLAYEDGATRPDVPVNEAMRDWPAHLGAPFADLNGIPGYQPESGDRPVMYGDQMQWWVMNDRGNMHERIGTNPLNIEVRGAAFAYDLPGVLRHTTFYRYIITNRNEMPIEDFYFGVFQDPDLGAAFDDYIGTDTTLGMIFTYNADNDDDRNYGLSPPAIGLTLISSSHEPNPDHERFSPQTLPGFNFTMNYVHCEFLCYGTGEVAYRVLQARFSDGQ